MYFSRAITTLAAMTAMLFFTVVCTADETQSSKAQEKSGITWVKYDEGLRLAEKLDKIIFVDFYTDWCKFCHKMDRETFTDKEIINYFNDNFVAVKINAESKVKLNLPDGDYNGREIAGRFGVRSYPTYWFLKPNGERINYFPGYAPPDRFLPVLQYVGGRHYENMSFQEFVDQNFGKK